MKDFLGWSLLGAVATGNEIEPTWESLAEHFVLAPPTEDIVITTLATGGLLDREIANIELMGGGERIEWNSSADALTIQLPQNPPGQIVSGFRIQLK